MKKSVVIVAFASICFTTFSDETQLMSEDIFRLLQAKYERDMSNETGRVFWHGKKIHTITDPSNNVVITTFEDGKRFVDKARIITPKMSVEAANKKLPITYKKGVPKKLVEARERRASEKSKGTVEITNEVKPGSTL